MLRVIGAVFQVQLFLLKFIYCRIFSFDYVFQAWKSGLFLYHKLIVWDCDGEIDTCYGDFQFIRHWPVCRTNIFQAGFVSCCLLATAK